MENNYRIQWLDVAKGMAIMLVVLGHSSLPAYANRFIFAFHMPFFFFASGYSSDFTKYAVGEYVGRKVKVLLIPFVVYSAINLLLQPYVSDLSYTEYWLRFLKEGWLGVPLWFVPVLFFSLIMTRIVFLLKGKKVMWVLVAFLPSVSILLKISDFTLPWNLAVVPYASFLVIIGNWGGRLSYNVGAPLISRYKMLLIILFFVVTGIISYFWKLDMCWNSILPFLPLLVGAITGSVFLSLFAAQIVKHSTLLTKVLVSIGKETYLILSFAEITIVYLNYFFTMNSMVKYILLIAILYMMWVIKKYVLIMKTVFINVIL